MDPAEMQSNQGDEGGHQDIEEPTPGDPMGFDSVFGSDSPEDDGIREEDGQAGAGNRGGENARSLPRGEEARGNPRGGDQAGGDDDGSEEARRESRREQPDDDGLEEVRLANGKSIRVTPEVAEELRKAEQLGKDYKHLQGEYTRLRQGQARGEGQDPSRPEETEAQRKARETERRKAIEDLDKSIYTAIEENDGKGVTEAFIRVADVRARAIVKGEIEEWVQQVFDPFKATVEGSLGDVMFDAVADKAIAEAAAEAELELDEAQRELAKTELRRIAKAKGEAPNRDHLNLAMIRVATGKVKPSRGRQPEPEPGDEDEPPLNPANLRRGPAPYSGSAANPSRTNGQPANRQRRAVHRADPLAAL